MYWPNLLVMDGLRSIVLHVQRGIGTPTSAHTQSTAEVQAFLALAILVITTCIARRLSGYYKLAHIPIVNGAGFLGFGVARSRQLFLHNTQQLVKEGFSKVIIVHFYLFIADAANAAKSKDLFRLQTDLATIFIFSPYYADQIKNDNRFSPGKFTERVGLPRTRQSWNRILINTGTAGPHPRF